MPVISKCPDDPEKTTIAMVAHASPGGNVPQWAAKTAVNALTPIEPFKLFHKIDENVKYHRADLRERLAKAEMVSLPGGRSPRPAGIAQIGYACFWPNGGGMKEGNTGDQNSAATEDQPSNETEGQKDQHNLSDGESLDIEESYNIEQAS